MSRSCELSAAASPLLRLSPWKQMDFVVLKCRVLVSHVPLHPDPPQALLFDGLVCRRLGLDDALAAHGSHRLLELALEVQSLDVIATTNASTVDQDVGHCATAGRLGKGGLDGRAKRVYIKLDHVRRGLDRVFFEENALSLGGEFAV